MTSDWEPIERAPLGIREGEGYRPIHIKGMTILGTEVDAWYRADGDYVDRWTDARGIASYKLTHFKRSD